jgi:hypothetical protein
VLNRNGASSLGQIGVGTSADTPAFAVEPVGSRSARYGGRQYRGAEALLIPANGGSNGHPLCPGG